MKKYTSNGTVFKYHTSVFRGFSTVSTPQIIGLLDAYRQGATKERLLRYIDTHFHALTQMPERAAALTWLLNLHPDLVQKRNAQRQRIGRAQPVLDGIQPASEE